MWPFKRREPERETRAAFPSVTAEHLAGRRAGVLSDGAVPLSATVAAIAQTWSRAFAMLDPDPDPSPLRADVLAYLEVRATAKGLPLGEMINDMLKKDIELIEVVAR